MHRADHTRLFVPGWWARAWELSHQRPQQDDSMVLRGVASGLLPTVDLTTLNLWCLLLADLQQQMLNPKRKSDDELVMSWADCRKLITGQDGGSLSRLSAALEHLAGLRLSVPNGESASNGSFATVRLFSGEQWLHCDQPEMTLLRLKPSSYTLEILAGYADGYIDLIRSLRGVQEARKLLAELPPLVLWKPVWLELTSAEQLVYLRMEKSMQWDMTWLQLEGVVGGSLESLFADLKSTRRALAGANGSVLMERLRVLGRLGRKLVAHGVIARESAQGFFALTAAKDLDRAGPMLVWQASSDRLRSLEEQRYFGQAAQSLLKHTVEPAIDDILTVLSVGISDPSLLGRMRSAWVAIKDRPGCALRTGPATIIQAHILFLELALRQMPGHRWPLPKEVLSLAFVKGCKIATDIAVLFDVFVERCGASPEIARCLSATPDLCLASQESRLPEDYRAIVQNILLAAAPAQKTEHVRADHKLHTGGQTRASSTAPVLQPRNPSMEPRDPLVAKMRKMAYEELERMMKSNTVGYRELQAAYVKSLDDSARQLMQDIQRRMQPQVFEHQLKERLVRFMVDHPSTWKSSSIAIQ